MEILKKYKPNDFVAAVTGCAVCIMSLVDIIRYAVLGQTVAFVTVLAVNVLFMLVAAAAVFGRIPELFAIIAGGALPLFLTTCNIGTTMFNATYLAQTVVAACGTVVGTVFAIVGKVKPKPIPIVAVMSVVAAILTATGAVWGGRTVAAKERGEVGRELWAVPTVFEKTDCPQKGTLEKLEYDTKACATDGRAVTKSAYVYLPYGYDGGVRYNVLYLLHGTGDDEEYWLKKYSYNVDMLDNMIYLKAIQPLIVVTPTFYVEDDCKESIETLDELTYSFKDELRNDLMPAVESKYRTYAETLDAIGFASSRRHRAFAGLSRGAVTTMHSVLCGSLDYFSSFGTFSASRTPAEYYAETNLDDENKELPIDCWYVASGAFDFGFESQYSDWKAIVASDSRLVVGQNTVFDNYPMRYHSMGNWHLALYNFLQKIFPKS